MTEGYSLFYMWEPYRQSLINAHLFFVEQSKERLLAQFHKLEQVKCAENFIEKWMLENSHRFDPDFYDEGDLYHEACERYSTLISLGRQVQFSVVAGMYYEWDKSLRKWLADEIRKWHSGETVLGEIWRVDFGKLTELLQTLGWKVREQEYFTKLDACRLVVNIYKHGNGRSFEELKENYPEYLPDSFGQKRDVFSGSAYLDYTSLKVTEEQMQDFSDAIVAFWQDVPEKIVDHDCLEVPDWFAKAMQADDQAENRK